MQQEKVDLHRFDKDYRFSKFKQKYKSWDISTSIKYFTHHNPFYSIDIVIPNNPVVWYEYCINFSEPPE